ncbi:NAD-dependent epimerase/dehydratase [Clostridium paraputrificum]|nr:NAD-dependent epimerase/dehydratase [Clostridium paraputrificum]
MCVVGERGVNFKSYYIGNRNLKKLKHIIEEVRDIVVPEMELKFGEFKDDSFIDYSSININELYEDTDYLVNSNFKTDILKTIEWLKK